MLPLRTFTRMLPKYVDDNGLPVPCDVLQPRPYVELSAYNGTVIKHYGYVKLQIRYGESEWQYVIFYVADTPGPVILGEKLSISLGIISVNTVYEMTLQVSDIMLNRADQCLM